MLLIRTRLTRLQELSPFEQMPQEIMLNIVQCLKDMTDDEAEVIDPRNPNLDILALHFTSKTLAAATLDQHNHVVGIKPKAIFQYNVNEFNDKFPLAVLACATCRMAKDIAVDGFDDNRYSRMSFGYTSWTLTSTVSTYSKPSVSACPALSTCALAPRSPSTKSHTFCAQVVLP